MEKKWLNSEFEVYAYSLMFFFTKSVGIRIRETCLYAGLPRDHPESYHYYMWNEFFKHVDIEPGHAHVLDGNAPDLVAECTRFEKLIHEAGGVHLFIGGKSFKDAALCVYRQTGSH